MTRVEDGRPYAWGRLYAALRTLRGLAVAGRVASVPAAEVRQTAGNPRNITRALLRNVGLQLFAARERGGTHAGAAAVVFADIATLVPPERMPLGTLSRAEAEEFRQGYEAQIAGYRKEWEGFFD
ncbi:hypothetical protein ACFWV1_21735 [Streptomyces sp. NPDC058700]|uniref:hypothetical protein n=1 Tax=unclassified Streptomyces TaxID=2593676 RepID=UPI0033DB0497